MLDKMLNSRLPAAEMKEQVRSHYSPAQSRSPAHGCIRISDIQYTLLDQIHDFPVECCLQPVRDVADNFLAELDRLFPDRAVKRDCLFDCFRRCVVTADHFDQRNDVWRIEWMADEDALGML